MVLLFWGLSFGLVDFFGFRIVRCWGLCWLGKEEVRGVEREII